MKRLLFPLLVFSASVVPSHADYLSERTAAMDLLNGGKYQEAADRFRKLGEAQKSDLQQADALSKAALALQKMQRHEEALDVAREIRLAPASKAAQIEVLKQARKWKELLAIAQEENFETWPDKLIFPAHVSRAEAYRSTGSRDEAENDFRAAAKATISENQKSQAFLAIGEMVREHDSKKAMEAYNEIVRLKPSGGMMQRAFVARARLFAESSQFDQALGEVAQLEKMQNKDAYWVCTTEIVYGDIHRKQGKKEEALANYRKAIAIPNAPAEMVKDAQAKLAALENES